MAIKFAMSWGNKFCENTGTKFAMLLGMKIAKLQSYGNNDVGVGRSGSDVCLVKYRNEVYNVVYE